MHITVILKWFVKALKCIDTFFPMTVENGCGSSTSHYSKIFLEVVQ